MALWPWDITDPSTTNRVPRLRKLPGNNKPTLTTMQEEINEFVEALYRFVANEIKRVTDPIYCQEGIKIVDARNHIFRLSDTLRTDEAEDTYALSDLCIVDEDMQTVPNRQRMYRIARNHWNG